MLFAFAFGIDKDVIKVYYHQNVKFLCQNLIDVALEYGQCVGQSKKHHLILKMAIASLEGYLPFITFFDSHSMVDISQIKLGETASPT